jgi:transposase
VHYASCPGETCFDSKKKTLHASERERDDVELLRWHYERLRRCSFGFRRRLLFFDESGVNLAMARLYARGPRGERVVGSVPKNWGDSVTVAACLTDTGIIAPFYRHGSMSGEWMLAYVEQVLGPELRECDILVMDNLAAHKSSAVREFLEARGAELIFLPPYSPDLNPIEQAWSKMKALLRKHSARTYDALLDAVASALRAISPQDPSGFIRASGYTA